MQEHWRLLYVGLTRAAERLIITGAQPRGEVPRQLVHRIRAAIERRARLRRVGWGGAGSRSRRRREQARRRPLNPSVARLVAQPAPEEERPPRPLAPSVGPDRDALPPPSPELRAAAERGRCSMPVRAPARAWRRGARGRPLRGWAGGGVKRAPEIAEAALSR